MSDVSNHPSSKFRQETGASRILRNSDKPREIRGDTPRAPQSVLKSWTDPQETNRWIYQLLPAIFLSLLILLLGAGQLNVLAQQPPVLRITKTADVAETTPGGAIEYTIRVTNEGPGVAQGVVVDDVIPAGTTYLSGTLTTTRPEVSFLNQTPPRIHWVGTLQENQEVVITFQTIVNNQQCPAPRIDNLAVVIFGQEPVAEAVAIVECRPHDLRITKTADVDTVEPGGEIEYTIEVANTGADPAEGVVIEDQIPAGTRYVPGSLTATSPEAEFSTTFNQVRWQGDLEADQSVILSFKVAVAGGEEECPSLIRNVAEVLQPGAVPLKAERSVKIANCTPPDINLTKRILNNQDNTTADSNLVPGDEIIYQLNLSSGDDRTHTVRVNDELPAGLIATAAEAGSGSVEIIHDGQVVVWEGRLAPVNTPVVITIKAKLTGAVGCGQSLTNQAHWSTEFHKGQSNVVKFALACRELGDAPDSSNNHGQKMTAYPGGAEANFPTVFKVAPPERGPMHLRPHLLHLGRRVSQEEEADIGSDADGVNNIKPELDRADLDRFDDGLELDKMKFSHCQRQRFPVWVNIHPALVTTPEAATAYLNVWLDSNRDGEWNDLFQACGDNVGEVFEHIVVDRAINIAALGPGLHKIELVTNRPVYWPDDLAKEPAWLRVTLSEKRSNKPLTGACDAPECAYGDGRGYDDPFERGETEDYLLRQPAPDPTVEKRGYIYRAVDFNTNDSFWRINWTVKYWNQGSAVANNVHVVDQYGPGQQLTGQRSYPSINPTITGRTLDYEVGALSPGREGYVFIRTRLPLNTAPGAVVTNEVRIHADNDDDTDNNVADASVTVPLLPPLITYPRPGTTCNGDLTITGRAQPDVKIAIFIDGDLKADDIPVDANGHWSYQVDPGLPDGVHFIQAVAAYHNRSVRSQIIKVIVNSELSWDPLSLSFIDPHNRRIFPKDEHGRIDVEGWRVFLRPGQTYKVSVRICCDDEKAAEVSLEVPGGQTISLTDPDGDKIFTGMFTMPQNNTGPAKLVLCVICQDVKHCSDGTVLIDPEGVVFNASQGKENGKLAGATVACYQAQSDLNSGVASLSLWPAANFDQINPQTTEDDGYYSFFTPAGTYQVEAIRSGYQSYRSPELPVVDAPVEFDIPLTPEISEPADHTIFVSEAGFSPAFLEIEPGDIVEWVNVGDQPHSSAGEAGAWDSGLLNNGDGYKREFTAEDVYTYADNENSISTGQIVVKTNDLYLPMIIKETQSIK